MTFLRSLRDEPQPDDTDTERLEPVASEPVFPLAGMGAMCTLVAPDGKTHWVRKGSMIFRVMKSHGYTVGGAA